MPDQSFLDNRYFVDEYVYNCPFCSRGHVMYSVLSVARFHWNSEKLCYIYIIECHSCSRRSMHLSYHEIELTPHRNRAGQLSSSRYRFVMGGKMKDNNLDDSFFYSVPTSFFSIDSRVPRVLRELLTEAEGCLKSNLLTGASACARKLIYELAIQNGIDDGNYEDRIKSLKSKHSEIEPIYFDNLLTIQAATSSKVHESAYDGWKSGHVRLILACIREVLHELYVLPALLSDRRKAVIELKDELLGQDQVNDED